MSISEWSSDGCSSDLLLPPSPVHVTASLLADGSVNVQWIRRSRQGGGWIDGVDAPLGEESERYRVPLRHLAGSERIVDVSQPSCRSEDQTSEHQTLILHSSAVFCFKKKNNTNTQ